MRWFGGDVETPNRLADETTANRQKDGAHGARGKNKVGYDDLQSAAHSADVML